MIVPSRRAWLRWYGRQKIEPRSYALSSLPYFFPKWKPIVTDLNRFKWSNNHHQ
ncbi:MAG: hypothetical protein AB4206_20730 [Xenococcaceae cyanobacterium]